MQENSTNRVISVDCMEGLESLPANSIDLLITDPPYMSPSLSGYGRWGLMKNFADMSSLKFYYKEFRKRLERVLKPNAPAFLFCDDKFYPVLYEAFYPWQNLSLVVWDKKRVGMGRPVRKCHELLLYANQGSADFNKHGDLTCFPSILRSAPDSNKIHPSQKPQELLKTIILGFTSAGDTVLDTFGGSGSTGVASLALGLFILLIIPQTSRFVN